MIWLKRFIPFFVILAFVVYACWPLFQPGFYTMHDDEQIGRLFDLDLAIKAGQFPPRIIPNLGFGYGYPFFNFYPPFAYYVGEVFYLLGFSLITSTKLMVFAGFFLSAIFMYLFSKEFFGKIGGTLSAISYTLLSYKAVDVYVRGAYAEFFAFVPIPLIFLSVYKISQRKRSWYLVWNAIAVAVLILSHNLIALMSLPFLLAWNFYALWNTKEKMRFFIELSVSFILGFLLSAYFFIPSYLERDQTMVNILTTELASYSLHFVCSYQLFDSMWGYGGSIPSCFDGISFEVGKVQLIASITVVILAITRLRIRSKEKMKYSVIVLNFSMLLASLFFMVKFSKPLWDMFPPFWYIQFPWRFLLFAGFFASFLTGAIVIFSKNRIVVLGLTFVTISFLVHFSIGRFIPQRTFNADDSFYTNLKKIRWETSGLAYEYVPNGIKTIKSDIGTTKIDIIESEIATSASSVLTGDMKVDLILEKPQLKKFHVTVLRPGLFQINTYSFPGWEIYVNGIKTEYNDNNKFKLVRLQLPTGEFDITAQYVDTPPRVSGNMASILGIIGVLGLICYIVKLQKNNDK